MKKVISFVTAVLLLLWLPTGVLPAAAAEVTSGTTGDCTWTLNGGVLTISGNGRMKDYYSYSNVPWGTNITKVIISNGVTHIGKEAFSHCQKLTSVTMPDSVTTIGENAFYYARKLKQITIPAGVTRIKSSTFWGCTGLENLSLPDGLLHRL
ncbi:MAG: leucine-rich repeat domain-containing protein [Clostridia bacterium]|nr:leucine-rich repeat domain-containing protein [Clostridia bacterium]